MTTEERLLRLENAFATLVELTRNMDERMDESNARQSVFESNFTTLENNLTALSQIVVELAQAQRRADERLDRLAKHGAQIDERLDKIAEHGAQIDERLDRLAEHGAQVDERLDRVAALLERHISEQGGES